MFPITPWHSLGEVEVMRVQCRAIKDDLEGWVTVSGACDGVAIFETLVDSKGE